MPFEKGNKHGNGNKGAKHKKTKEWEALAKDILGDGATRFKDAIGNLSDEKYINAYMQVLEYFQPKLQRTENLHEVEGITVNIIKPKSDS